MALPIPSPPTLMVIAMIPLYVWRMVRRLKRLIGRQKFSRRHWATVTLMPALLAAILWYSPPSVNVSVITAVTVLAGIGLALYSLHLTHFEEVSPEGSFYTPHPAMGIALSMLIGSRIMYRLWQLLHDPSQLTNPATSLGNSPITMGIFGLIIGYYVAYAIGVLLWQWSHKALK